MKPEAYRAMALVQADHWWYRGRRAVLQTLCQGLDIHKVLEVGCGTGSVGPVASRLGWTMGVDPSREALIVAGRMGYEAVIQAGAEALPIHDEAFDLVLCLDVLEHLDQDRRAVAELFRVTARGGSCVVFVPAFSWLWGLQDEVSMHRRRYDRAGLVGLMEDAGFVVRRSGYFNTILMPAVAAVRFAWRHVRWAGTTENTWTPSWLNKPLSWILGLEADILRFVDLPLGISAYVVASKPPGVRPRSVSL